MSEIIYGIHTVQVLLECNPQRFLNVYILKGRVDGRRRALVRQLQQENIVIQRVNRQWLDERAERMVHQGVMAEVKESPKFQEEDLPLLLMTATPLLLVLDGVTDPHNLGACLRCAAAVGVHAVIVPRDRSARLNATVKKVASGGAEMVPLIRVTNLARTLSFLQKQNVWVIGTVCDLEHDLYQSDLTRPLALVMGGEGRGMRHLTQKYCNELISIPMVGLVSSLNVSVAAGVCLFEVFRQRIGM